MFYYVLFYFIGLVAGFFSPTESMRTALNILEPITLTALVASLLVPFAGFASNERWQRFALQYAIVPLFGIYTVVLWRTYAVVGLLLLVCASIVHAGYWMSSIHSREYRLRQFELGFADSMPDKARLIAVLNAVGRAEEADEIIKLVFQKHLEGMTSQTQKELQPEKPRYYAKGDCVSRPPWQA